MLIRVLAIGLASLIAATWRLWTPLRSPPRLPAFGWLANLPPAIDYLLLVGLAACVAAAMLRPRRQRWLGIAALCMAMLMLSDQLRWQPWAYQFLLFGIAVSTLPAHEAKRWLRVLMVSIYLYAAIAKIDVVFAGTLGQQMLKCVAGAVGIAFNEIPDVWRTNLALAMPAAELAVGLLLIPRKTRRVGVVSAMLLHAMLIVVLSPLGLGHAVGVLLWNGVTATLVAILFWPEKVPLATSEAPPNLPRVLGWASRGILVIAIVAPLTYPLGWWDRWPSWGLYAPRGERAAVYIHSAAIDRLPESLPMGDARGESPWRRVLLDQWLLEQTGVPLYPQNRVTVALALALDQRYRLGGYLRTDLDTRAERWSGARLREAIESANALQDYADDRYWLSTESQWTR